MATKKKQKEKVIGDGFISKAVLRNVKVSPQKARLVVDQIRGKGVSAALQALAFGEKKSAPLLKKLLLSAVANAKDRSGVNIDELFVKRAWVDGTMVLKRFMPRAQGRATPIRKRFSTITIVLDERP